MAREEAGNPKVQSPGALLRQMLQRFGWTQDDLSMITGRSITAINNVATGRSSVTPEMAGYLAAAFGNSAEDWLQAEATYRLSLLDADTADIQERAKLFAVAPVREMQRRGWIRQTDSSEQIAAELDRFLGKQNEPSTLAVAMRKSHPTKTLTPAESAWCLRARQMAETLLVTTPFSAKRANALRSGLRELAGHPKSSRLLSKTLADFGIRLVIVEPLANVRIDGAAFWDDKGPVVAISLRHDRIDGFWFTLMHECSHILHGDPASIDREMVNAVEGVMVQQIGDETEDRANREAASSLVPSAELESFIGRVGPLYSRDRIVQFANRIHIHPGIIVGQLQYRGEIGYSAMRDYLVKIRDCVVSTALTDGWGQILSPSFKGEN